MDLRLIFKHFVKCFYKCHRIAIFTAIYFLYSTQMSQMTSITAQNMEMYNSSQVTQASHSLLCVFVILQNKEL